MNNNSGKYGNNYENNGNKYENNGNKYENNERFNGNKPRNPNYNNRPNPNLNSNPNPNPNPNRYQKQPFNDTNSNYKNKQYSNNRYQNNPNNPNNANNVSNPSNPNMQMFRDNQNNTDTNMNINYIKKLLIEYINTTVNLSNYKYKLIEYEHDLQLLKEKMYMISPNYMGVNGLLIFLKVNDQFLSFIIDKKYLTYNLEKIDYSKIKIIPIKHHLDETIYDGTIIDGVLLFDDRDGMKKFVINDLYYFRGQNLTENRMAHKIVNISAYFQSVEPNNTNILNDTVFIVNKLYNMDEIDNLINKYIPKLPYSKAVSGVAFYPEFSAMKLIYLFSNSNEIDKPPQQNYKQNQQQNYAHTPQNHIQHTHVQHTHAHTQQNYAHTQQDMKSNEYEIIENDKSDDTNLDIDTLTFKIKKTNINDVYHLYLGELLPENRFKYNKIGLACIPTIECSHFCRDSFVNSNGMDLLMDCKYDDKKNVWTPIRLAKGKRRPDLVEKLNAFVQK
jgi:hypothetical protein